MTTVLIDQEQNLLFSSDPANGALNRSPSGAEFQVILQDGIKIPTDALNVTVSITEASIWWTIPNISTELNNDKMYITGFNVLDVPTNYIITIEKGLYDLNYLENTILRELENQGAKISPLPLINLQADESINKVILKLNYNGVSVNFAQTDTPRNILGFDALIYTNTPQIPSTLVAPNVAAFNSINYLLLHCDLLTKGIRINNKYSQTVSKIDIDTVPGSQIIYRPFNQVILNANELTGEYRNNINVWLTDDRDNLVDTNGEYYSMMLNIKYKIPIVI